MPTDHTAASPIILLFYIIYVWKHSAGIPPHTVSFFSHPWTAHEPRVPAAHLQLNMKAEQETAGAYSVLAITYA